MMGPMNEIRVGIVGYSAQKFDEKKASSMIVKAFDALEKITGDYSLVCVSGLTNLGIPAIAYKEAKKRGWKTVGVACEKAKEFELFPVDEKHIVGKEWGDESKKFLSMVDMIIRIGGGKQSKEEAEKAKNDGKLVFEYELEAK